MLKKFVGGVRSQLSVISSLRKLPTSPLPTPYTPHSTPHTPHPLSSQESGGKSGVRASSMR
ncbi:MAG: hypothetical protein EWV64_03150 [Microcystis flos-aquae Ma_QC_C_20070823_S18]|uniref:Uncharacterized protein n=1 Tax=Microcystis flos-aquae Mf_QC_C_20070823_S10D TaxID=2486236 RepID=A0A552L2S9_9CHRO|nr:MAG: hypothetical protein EWV64_03150 [Microcystis flos-aquae Ma_QC_C_20070823_S18]TRT99939.1 MAG: hypothetical protein EWV65_07020 [Microcystis flos-aquae Ma_QC_C_20070823_S18D]TRV14534.1 MAG: hypothetical protein EWV45_05180 [Microcystis flos-aquae Mf_QC_C_20070823_S10D]TRV25110.1 MAG: hypothetical protein EWV72_10100 [Microcystis flos-aquae Mf_QC_C_20070823_S10]TRV31267.1 MAG: hypothetical protein EWV71_20200 [Microcystis flos-aquae Mf_QC_C_20070823_S20D]TRV31308.1 MAG: hypothetical prot